MISVRAAVASCLLAACAVGASIAVTPFIADLPVLTAQAARYAVAAAVLFAVLPRLDPLRARGAPSGRDLGRLALAAATGSAGFNVLLVAASRHADPSAVGAVVGASPVVLALLAAGPGAGAGARPGAHPRARPRPRVLAGALAACAGVVVIHGGGRSTALGLVLAVGVLACEVAFTLVAAPLLTRVGPARTSAWTCALAAAMLAATALITGEAPRGPTTQEAATLAYQGLVTTAVAFVLWYRGVERLGPDRAGVTMAAAPLAAVVTAAAVGTGVVTPATGVGAVLVAAGIAAATTTRLSRAARRPASAAVGGRTASRA